MRKLFFFFLLCNSCRGSKTWDWSLYRKGVLPAHVAATMTDAFIRITSDDWLCIPLEINVWDLIPDIDPKFWNRLSQIKISFSKREHSFFWWHKVARKSIFAYEYWKMAIGERTIWNSLSSNYPRHGFRCLLSIWS